MNGRWAEVWRIDTRWIPFYHGFETFLKHIYNSVKGMKKWITITITIKYFKYGRAIHMQIFEFIHSWKCMCVLFSYCYYECNIKLRIALNVLLKTGIFEYENEKKNAVGDGHCSKIGLHEESKHTRVTKTTET